MEERSQALLSLAKARLSRRIAFWIFISIVAIEAIILVPSYFRREQELLERAENVSAITPKHCSWLNQIEIWFGILMRKLLRRGNFISQADLKSRILAFVDYFNCTMAKPFKWTYKGKALAS